MPRGAVILYGCLMGYGGKVIASHNLGGSLEEDADRFSNAVTSVLDFVERTYPSSQPEPFEVLDHGAVRVLVEKGRYCMLILIIEGKEDEALREGIREILERFEARNGAGLAQDALGHRIRRDGRDSLSMAANLMKVF
ncbi:MAG: hypothetical protein ACE5KQ_01200 [Thermoplasmata archaeon]